MDFHFSQAREDTTLEKPVYVHPDDFSHACEAPSASNTVRYTL